MNNFRIATRAVLFVGEKLLLIKYRDSAGEYYACVGGGQETGESMRENLLRECREEIGCEPEIGDMLFTRETEFILEPIGEPVHQIEHYFLCRLPDGTKICEGSSPDLTAAGFGLFSVDELESVRLFPDTLPRLIKNNFSERYICEL